MDIGILYEGDKDIRALKVLIGRIVKLHTSNIQTRFISYPADGPILSKIPAAYSKFFVNNNCSFAVFVMDTDGNSSKFRQVYNQSKKSDFFTNIVIWAIDPEFEQIFFDEENALKKIFDLTGNLTIPYSNLKPKERFKRIHDESEIIGIEETVKDTGERIAKIMDINMITAYKNKKCPSFKKLNKDISKMLKQVISSL